jgi:hypothetical protein
MEAIAHPPACDRAHAAVHYDDVARALFTSYKYTRPHGSCTAVGPVDGARRARIARRRRRTGAAALTTIAGTALQPAGGACPGGHLGSDGVPVLHEALGRVHAMPQQVGLTRAQRADNVQDAFRVPAEEKANAAWC